MHNVSRIIIAWVVIWSFVTVSQKVNADSPLTLDLTASSDMSGQFPVTHILDGDPSTFWSSNVHATAGNSEWIVIEFNRHILLNSINLTPRNNGLGFPMRYQIEYGYDDAGNYWFPIPGQRHVRQSSPTGTVSHTFVGKHVAKRLRITATELGKDDFNNHYFQLAGLSVTERDTPVPFATSLGGDFDARMNMLWYIYGSMEDVSMEYDASNPGGKEWQVGNGAVYNLGNEPAWYEWMPLRFCWTPSTENHFNTLVLNRMLPWAQSSDGYIWSWANQERWPTAETSFHQENNAKYILGWWRYWSWYRDDSIFDRVDNTVINTPASPSRPDVSQGKTVQQKIRDAMRYLEDEVRGNEGGITIQDNDQNTDGTVNGEPTNYWDNWLFGHKNAYDNIYYYAALEAMAEMEAHWGEPERAAQLMAYREGAKTHYEELFFDEEKGRFIGWIDINGIKRDFGFTFVNLEALAYGLGTSSMAQQIFSWLDGERIIEGENSTGDDIYYWRWGARANTIAAESVGPPYLWEDIFGNIRVDTPAAQYGNHLENGGGIFYVSYYDLMARLKHLGPDNALERLEVILDEFQIDQLRRDPAAPGSTHWQIGIIGEYPESGMVPTFMIHGFGGLHANINGLNISPKLPAEWEYLQLNKVRYAGVLMYLTIKKQEVVVTVSENAPRTLFSGEKELTSGSTTTLPLSQQGSVLLSLEPVPEEPTPHSADLAQNGQIDLSELLHVVSFYNSGAFHCVQVEGKTIYAPGAGMTNCPSHNSDYNPADWQISFGELLRLVQLYNAGAYYPNTETEDGFAPGLHDTTGTTG